VIPICQVNCAIAASTAFPWFLLTVNEDEEEEIYLKHTLVA